MLPLCIILLKYKFKRTENLCLSSKMWEEKKRVYFESGSGSVSLTPCVCVDSGTMSGTLTHFSTNGAWNGWAARGARGVRTPLVCGTRAETLRAPQCWDQSWWVHAMNPANETRAERSAERLLFAAGTYKLLAVTIGTIGLFGFCNNAVVIVLFCRFKRLRTPTNLLLVNISLSDFLVSVIGINFTFVSCVKGGWIWSHATCVWDGFCNSLFGEEGDHNLFTSCLLTPACCVTFIINFFFFCINPKVLHESVCPLWPAGVLSPGVTEPMNTCSLMGFCKKQRGAHPPLDFSTTRERMVPRVEMDFSVISV